MLIGVVLVADGMGQHISKGYIYFAMTFALLVEMINMRLRRAAPVQLHSRFENDPDAAKPGGAPLRS
jgi:predicted tellurium resistance membrane protein TerC